MTDYIAIHYTPIGGSQVVFYAPIQDDFFSEFPILPRTSQLINSFKKINKDKLIIPINKSEVITTLENLCQDEQMYRTCERQKTKEWVQKSTWEDISDERQTMTPDELFSYYSQLNKPMKIKICIILNEYLIEFQ
jgi:hypothetical protein